MQTIRLKKQLAPADANKLAGAFLTEESYDHLVRDDCVVYKPDGSILLRFCKARIPAETCKLAFEALKDYPDQQGSGNRGLAGGKVTLDRVTPHHRRQGIKISNDGFRYTTKKKDGTWSNVLYANETPSAIIGYFDRYARIPYCRMTRFNMNHPEKFKAATPYIKAVDGVFAKEMKDRYKVQRDQVNRTSQDFVINGTAFSTLTLNRNWQTAVHKDAGDFKAGFGVMSVLRAGLYTGGHLVFPAFRVAVDMSTGDVLLADVHEWHGNTPILGRKDKYVRLSCVFYYREKMKECGTAQQELERAKNRNPGQSIHE